MSLLYLRFFDIIAFLLRYRELSGILCFIVVVFDVLMMNSELYYSIRVLAVYIYLNIYIENSSS